MRPAICPPCKETHGGMVAGLTVRAGLLGGIGHVDGERFQSGRLA